MQNNSHLYTTYKTLPEEVRDCLAAHETDASILAIARDAGLSGSQLLALPHMILRLVTHDVEPEQFRAALAEEAHIDAELAKKITNSLKERVLAPIAQPLQFAGVDIQQLNNEGGALTNNESAPGDEQSAQRKAPTDDIQSMPPTQPAAPFILHQEESAVGPSFIFNPGDAPAASQNAPKVIIERVVHYSPLRTALNQAQIPKHAVKKVDVPHNKWFV